MLQICAKVHQVSRSHHLIRGKNLKKKKGVSCAVPVKVRSRQQFFQMHTLSQIWGLSLLLRPFIFSDIFILRGGYKKSE